MMRNERHFLRIALLAGIFPAVLVAGAARSESLDLVRAQPIDNGVLKVAPVTGGQAGDTETWRLKHDAWFENTGAADATLFEIEVGYEGEHAPDPITIAVDDGLIGIGDTVRLTVIDGLDRDLLYPLPERVVFTFRFSSDELESVYRLADHHGPGVLGSYHFPGRSADLTPGSYWSYKANHTDASRGQRYGYDLGVRRWDGSEWIRLHPDTEGDENADFLIWGTPVYAMANGAVVSCRRDVEDNVVGIRGEGAGNSLRILHGDEYALYAHLQNGTINDELCPETGVYDPGIPVSEGQYLGLVGNSGRSTNPHLHVHVQLGPPFSLLELEEGDPGYDEAFEASKDEADGRPLRFHNVRVREAGSAWDGYDPEDPDAAGFLDVDRGGQLHSWVLIDPSPCGWSPATPGLPEVTRIEVPHRCYGDVFNDVVQSGYWIHWFDGFDLGNETLVNGVWRPAPAGSAVAHVFGVDSDTYQLWHDQTLEHGLRPTLVESYLVRGEVRYAAIFRAAPAAFQAYHRVAEDDHVALAEQLRDDGYRPVNVSVVSPAGQRAFTGLWVRKAPEGWLLNTWVPHDEYQDWIDAAADDGLEPAYVNAYEHGGEIYFSAIVRANGGLDAQTESSLLDYEYELSNEHWVEILGYTTEAVTGYPRTGQIELAAVWRLDEQ